jgi:branched-chain amino acid aminotransferase
MQSLFVCINGKILNAEQASIAIDNRTFRYGIGLFETLLVINKEVQQLSAHWSRLQQGLQILGFKTPSFFNEKSLLEAIQTLLSKNKHHQHARVRIQFFANAGGILETQHTTCNYLIETYAIDPTICELNENGLEVGLHTLYKKEIDPLSPYKINGRICYAMAAQEAKEKKWNDALVLNSHGNIIESSISNIFWVKNKEIFTPPVSEGCIAGIMRAHWIAVLKEKGIPVIEMPLIKELLLQADEVFLTNSIRKIRWVSAIENKQYKNEFILKNLLHCI